jgi:hypothetical protein
MDDKCGAILKLLGDTEYFETYDDAYSSRSVIEVPCTLAPYHDGVHRFRRDTRGGPGWIVVEWTDIQEVDLKEY